MNFDIILIIGLTVHFIADFVAQTHEQAINKSHDFGKLLQHTVTYSWIWFCIMLIVYSISSGGSSLLTLEKALSFAGLTLIAHTITDYLTSKLSKKYFSVQNFHNGFVVVGFDQILHYIQLYYTYKLLL